MCATLVIKVVFIWQCLFSCNIVLSKLTIPYFGVLTFISTPLNASFGCPASSPCSFLNGLKKMLSTNTVVISPWLVWNIKLTLISFKMLNHININCNVYIFLMNRSCNAMKINEIYLGIMNSTLKIKYVWENIALLRYRNVNWKVKLILKQSKWQFFNTYPIPLLFVTTMTIMMTKTSKITAAVVPAMAGVKFAAESNKIT